MIEYPEGVKASSETLALITKKIPPEALKNLAAEGPVFRSRQALAVKMFVFPRFP
jgi:hypothetical protein